MQDIGGERTVIISFQVGRPAAAAADFLVAGLAFAAGFLVDALDAGLDAGLTVEEGFSDSAMVSDDMLNELR